MKIIRICMCTSAMNKDAPPMRVPYEVRWHFCVSCCGVFLWTEQAHLTADTVILPTTVALDINTGDHQPGPQVDRLCSYEEIDECATIHPQGDQQLGPPVDGISSYTKIDGRATTHRPRPHVFLHRNAEYTNHLLGPGWNEGGFERSGLGRAYADKTVVKGFRGEEGERGSWVGYGGNEVEESKSGFTFPPRASFLDPSSIDGII